MVDAIVEGSENLEHLRPFNVPLIVSMKFTVIYPNDEHADYLLSNIAFPYHHSKIAAS